MTTIMRPNNNNNNSGAKPMTSFYADDFFRCWLICQHDHLHELTSAIANLQNIPDHELDTLVSQVLSHYQQYYTSKAIVTHEHHQHGDDNNNAIFKMFSPPWFSSSLVGQSFLWIAGFKPSLAFKLLNSSVHDMSNEQKERVGRLMMETKAAETELNNHMAMIQESLATPPILELAVRMTSGRRGVDEGFIGDVDTAIQGLREAMENLVEDADLVRMTTARKVVEILSPAQAVRFLAADSRLQLKIHT